MTTEVTGETKTYVEVMYPGILFSESSVEEVDYRDPYAVAKKYKNAFGFRFFDQERTEVKVGSKKQTVSGERKNESKFYYPDGETYTVADVKKLKGDHSILISNMEGNGYKKVVRTRMGNFQPFDSKTDEII
jgi:hypothetical protein